MKNIHRASSPKIIFFDRLSLVSLPHVLRYGHSAEMIWFFRGRRKFLILLKMARRLGIMRASVQYISNEMAAQWRDNYQGSSSFVRVLADEREMRWKIKREKVRTNPLVQAMQGVWPIERMLVYFDRAIYGEIRQYFRYITSIKQILSCDLCIDPAESLFFIRERQWFPFLYDYAHSKDVNLMQYDKNHVAWQYLCSLSRVFLFFLGFLYKRLMHLMKQGQPELSVFADKTQKNDLTRGKASSRVAISYRGGELSFDPTERSSLFWTAASGIPVQEMLIYGYMYRSSRDSVLKNIAAQGITVFTHGPGPFAWQPTNHMDNMQLHIIMKLALNIVRCLGRGQPVALYYIHHLLELAHQYTYWYDFYAANQICVDVDSTYTTGGSVIAAAKIMAMEAWQGVSVNYQYALGYNILTLQPNVQTGEDVQFVFSRWMEQTWRSIGAPYRSYVHVGYLYDTAFQELREAERVQYVRQQLRSQGAQFVLCYLDELSSVEEYEHFLHWVLEDPTLGIIFKPKYPEALFRRINRISGLVEQAKQTGRCVFLSNIAGGRSKVFPAEAALMSDLCVGMLLGTTAALEARLAGTPTLLMDLHHMYNHPFYHWGAGKVVFDKWDALRAAVERYRADPQAYPEFGNWSQALNDLDPFQDGQASIRIGQYIGWIYNALQQGAAKQEALQTAAHRYAERWGEKHVSLMEQ